MAHCFASPLWVSHKRSPISFKTNSFVILSARSPLKTESFLSVLEKEPAAAHLAQNSVINSLPNSEIPLMIRQDWIDNHVAFAPAHSCASNNFRLRTHMRRGHGYFAPAVCVVDESDSCKRSVWNRNLSWERPGPNRIPCG